MKATICIPTWTTGHHMLMDCVKNVRETTGCEPVVWRTDENVAVARSQATTAMDTEYICFLDTDAFPQEPGWLDRLVQIAEESGADIVSPNEILWFSPSKTEALWPERDKPYVVSGPPTVAGMCVLVRRGKGVWDTHIGLTHGRLGPCIEDTDFAYSIAAQGGRHVKEPRVHVLHKDRGAPDFDTWRLTHEYLCYEIMSELLAYKWKVIPGEERAGFFSGLGSVPGKGQRYLADGYGIKHLIECYAPVAEKIPGRANEALWRIENLAEHHLWTLRHEERQGWKGREDVPEPLTRNIRGDWGGPGSTRTPRIRVRE